MGAADSLGFVIPTERVLCATEDSAVDCSGRVWLQACRTGTNLDGLAAEANKS